MLYRRYILSGKCVYIDIVPIRAVLVVVVKGLKLITIIQIDKLARLRISAAVSENDPILQLSNCLSIGVNKCLHLRAVINLNGFGASLFPRIPAHR